MEMVRRLLISEQAPDSLLRAFLDLDDLARHQTMRFAVNRLRGFFARSVNQAKNGAAVLVEPVLDVINPVLLLHFQVARMRACHRFLGQSLQITVNVHKQCHYACLLPREECCVLIYLLWSLTTMNSMP